MPTIDALTSTTASVLDSDDMFLISQDGTVKKLPSSELKKILNTVEEVGVTATTYTLLSTDQGKIVRATNASAKTFTVPPTSGFTIGLPIAIRNASATDITLSAGTGVTLNASSLTIGENTSFALIPRATDEWDVYTGSSGGLTTLSTPTLTMTAASDTAMDFSWTNVANESSYYVQIAEDAGFTTGVQTATPAADDTAHQFTGLTASTTYYGRVKAVGDGVTYSDSAYGSDNEPTSAGGGGYDADAQTFFDYIETTLGATLTLGEKTAVNDLVVDRKAASLWAKDIAIYPRVGDTIAAMGVNLKSPGTYPHAYTGTPTVHADGISWAGGTDYASLTGLDVTALGSSNVGQTFYIQSNLQNVYVGAPSGTFFLAYLTDNTTLIAYPNIGNQSSGIAIPDLNNAGLNTLQRLDANDAEYYRGSTKIGEDNTAFNSMGTTGQDITVHRHGTTTNATAVIESILIIHQAFSGAEQTDNNTTVSDFITALGR